MCKIQRSLGEMKMTWAFTDVPGGTNVAIRGENAPAGIRPEDHEAGFRSTLENLAVFTEDTQTP